jgi:hypothetical protein
LFRKLFVSACPPKVKAPDMHLALLLQKIRLGTFTLIYSGEDLQVQDNESPELIEFEVHPKLFGFREFL